MKKILIVTGTRAEYGLLKNLVLKLQADREMETHLAVTGTHLSVQHGMTVDLIVKDDIKNIHRIDLRIHGDKPNDLCDGIGTGIGQFSRLMSQFHFDLMILLGDRYELWAPAMAATINTIPIAHIHGGESTEGLIDEVVRHSLTKISHLHMCSHDHYKKRILQMGENPRHVWNVGAIGLDRIRQMVFLSRSEIENRIKTSFAAKNILCTFHPVTLDEKQSLSEIQQLVNAIEDIVKDGKTKVFITLPNADTFSGQIRQAWEELIAKFPSVIFGYVNLGDQLYLSLMKEVDIVLGNSSSGILEAPFLRKAVVDVGRRQEGRLRSKHILHSDGTLEDLKVTIRKSLSAEFQAQIKMEPSIYGEGESVEKIYQILKSTDLKNIIFKKFHEVNF